MKSDRKRIRVACNACRRKKVRCDGQPSCQHCVQAKDGPCVYELRPAGSSKRMRVLKKSVDSLGERVRQLESVVASICATVGMLNPLSGQNHEKSHTGLESESGSDYESEDSPFTAKSEWSCGSQWPHKPSSDQKATVYFGAHSLLGILLESSMQWMENNLGPEKSSILMPLKNMPVIFQLKARRLLLHWLDPAPMDAREKARMLTSPFPKNSGPVLHLIRNYYTTICLVESSNPDMMLSKFEKYYAHKNSSKPVFGVSTLLSMCVAFLQAICLRVESWAKDSLPQAAELTSGEFSPTELAALQNQLLNYVVAYYHRLSIIGEGEESVEALLLLVQFIDKEYIAGEISYLVLSLAIRLAYALGFHRVESYAHLTESEVLKRRYLWSLCRYLDMQTCFRTGRNPIINYSDISPEILLFHVDKTNAYLKMEELTRYFEAIFQCRFNSYSRLFSAPAKLSTFAELSANLDFLNQEMATSVIHLPQEMRPVFYNDPSFKLLSRLDSLEDELNLTCLLTYFSHMMLINRLPLMMTFPDAEIKDKEKYKQLSLNSARTILHTVMAIDRDSFSGSFRSWAMFFPMTAVLHLLATCMSFPTSAEAISDLRLLIDAVVKIFNSPKPPKVVDAFEYGDMTSLILVFVKTVLRVTVTILESKTGICIIGSNSSLHDILFPTQKAFPELYESFESFKKSMCSNSIVFSAKSPFAPDSPAPKSTLSSSLLTPTTDSGSKMVSLTSSVDGNCDFGLLLADAQLAQMDNINMGGNDFDLLNPSSQYAQFFF